MTRAERAVAKWVKVFKLFINEFTKQKTIALLHEGYLVTDTGTHLKVWNPAKNSGDGPDSDAAYLYPKKSRRIWCETAKAETKQPVAALNTLTVTNA